jgi:LuxR family transcriptional regulator, maltose regulon positive regulatory protein
MSSILLSPNIRIPPERSLSIVRDRLIRALDVQTREHRVMLVTAPAGYGKTTLLAQWAHQTSAPVAWLTVEQDADGSEWLLRGLVAAWDAIEPGIRDSPVGLIAGSMSPDPETVIATFISAAGERQDPLVFVLDDSHHLVDAGALGTLAVLIARLPQTCRFVLAGRGEPAVPLARHRAHGDLAELGAGDLRLRDDELRAFLTARLANPLPDAEIASIQRHLEGWFAGVQLVCHAIERRPDPSRDVLLSGKHRFVAAYLREDVLDALTEERRQFLLRTSIFDRLCAGLCDAVTERRDGQTMLETLEREGLFLDALDDGLEWFRYHSLFRDVLKEELQRAFPEDVQPLHRKAAEWYRDHELPDQAFTHAVAGGDAELTMRIVEDYAVIKLESGELAVVGRWIDTIP